MHQLFGHGTIVKTIFKDLTRTQVLMHKGCALRNETTWRRFDAKCRSNLWRPFFKSTHNSEIFEGTCF